METSTAVHLGVPELVGAVAAFLALAAAASVLTGRVRFPFTVALVLMGAALAQLGAHGPEWVRPLAELRVSPQVILFVFLPALIFESAFNLDAAQLRRNLTPILVLAAPGLLLSTAVLGGIVWAVSPLSLPLALLLGAILSATDPVAVISIFKQLGAPRRLTVLVEGESLFNDATSIVAARILLGVIAAGAFSGATVAAGALEFVTVFAGGVLVGWGAALLTGWLLGLVTDEPAVEISLSVALAYAAFLLAEELFHVSGVMAVVAAGVVLGGWGRAKISPSALPTLQHLWEYLAYAANALIFLLVGLSVRPAAIAGVAPLLGWVILAMLLSRALVVFGLIPLVTRLHVGEPTDWRYQLVMVWGGLRGAIALAIALSLTDPAYAPLFVTVVTGAVLFTLLAQGLTIEALVRRLGLDRPPAAERFALAEEHGAAKRQALSRLQELERGGLFSARVGSEIAAGLQTELAALEQERQAIRETGLHEEEERRLLLLRGFATERAYYYELFAGGHMSERAYRALTHGVDVQADSLRDRGHIPDFTLHPPRAAARRAAAVRLLCALLPPVGERVRQAAAARAYEELWARHQAALHVLEELDALEQSGVAAGVWLAEARTQWQRWRDGSRRRLDETAELFPEFVAHTQARLASRLALQAEQKAIERAAEHGAIAHNLADAVVHELGVRIRGLRGTAPRAFQVSTAELLRKVPFFQALPPADFERIAARLRPHTVPAGEVIIEQGERGDSLWLVTRGVVRVSRSDGGETRDLATLLAGDFFGEMALLHGEPRTATCRAVTSCVLHELRRDDFDAVRQVCPGIQLALESVERERRLVHR